MSSLHTPTMIKEQEWPSVAGRRRRAPEGYESVQGTENDLSWAAHPHLRQSYRYAGNMCSAGQQYVVFFPWQAYPHLVLHLSRKPSVSQQFRDDERLFGISEAETRSAKAAQQQLGMEDKELNRGTRIWIFGIGCGHYETMKKNMFSLNEHIICFQPPVSPQKHALKLADPKLKWRVVALASSSLDDMRATVCLDSDDSTTEDDIASATV